MTRTNQGGSVASFMLIGAVLVLVTAGLLFWMRHPQMASVAVPKTTPEVAVTPKSTPEPKESTKTPTPAPSKSAAPTPAPSKSVVPTPTPTPKASPKPTATATPSQPAVSEFSQTGPAEMRVVLQLLAVGLLTGSTIALVSSYKQRSSL